MSRKRVQTNGPKVDLQNQSIEYYEGEGPIRRCATHSHELISELNGLKTVYELFSVAFEKNAKRNCLGEREKLSDGTYGGYKWQTYEQVKSRIVDFASGLRDIGIEPKSFIGIYSVNRPEWIVTSLACTTQSMPFVPLYDTLGPDAAKYVINHAELATVVCSAKTFPRIADISKDCPSLKLVILMDPMEPKFRSMLPDRIQLITMQSVIERGRKAPRAATPPQPTDLWCVMYTSGTTGNPKGVMITNRNVISTVAAFSKVTPVYANDVHISYLPLAHIYELVVQLVGLFPGAATGFWRGDIAGLMEDIQVLRPTILVGVPRVFNRVYDRVMAQLNEGGAIKRAIFNYAYSNKQQAMAAGYQPSGLWDRLVFKKIQEALGGRVRLITSGSAPLSPEVHEFLRVATNAVVVQGYGMTENCAGCTAQLPEDKTTAGHCGPPVACCEIKLVDVPEMGYTSSGFPQRGEICVRGPNVFIGYYKDEEKTKEVLEPNGWLHTGDIGEWLPSGALKIIDRKKNIFKLAQGEYVAAEYLETLFVRSKYIMQIFVYGDSMKNHLVAIIVPDPETLVPWAKANGISTTDMPSLCKNPRVKKLIFDEMVQLGHSAKLPHFQFVKQFYLEPDPWTVENGMLTPSMKLKRPQLKNRYSDIIEQLYKESPMDINAKL